MSAEITEYDLGLLTLQEAAEVACVTVRTVRHWINRQQVEVVELDGDVWLLERSVLDCERARRRAGRGRPRRVA